MEGKHEAQVIPDAAFDLDLQLHISRNMHLHPKQQQAEGEVCTGLLTPAMKQTGIHY